MRRVQPELLATPLWSEWAKAYPDRHPEAVVVLFRNGVRQLYWCRKHELAAESCRRHMMDAGPRDAAKILKVRTIGTPTTAGAYCFHVKNLCFLLDPRDRESVAQLAAEVAAYTRSLWIQPPADLSCALFVLKAQLQLAHGIRAQYVNMDDVE